MMRTGFTGYCCAQPGPAASAASAVIAILKLFDILFSAVFIISRQTYRIIRCAAIAVPPAGSTRSRPHRAVIVGSAERFRALRPGGIQDVPARPWYDICVAPAPAALMKIAD